MSARAETSTLSGQSIERQEDSTGALRRAEHRQSTARRHAHSLDLLPVGHDREHLCIDQPCARTLRRTILERLLRDLALPQVYLVRDEDDGQVDAERAQRRQPVLYNAIERLWIVDGVDDADDVGASNLRLEVRPILPPRRGVDDVQRRVRARRRGDRDLGQDRRWRQCDKLLLGK